MNKDAGTRDQSAHTRTKTPAREVGPLTRGGRYRHASVVKRSFLKDKYKTIRFFTLKSNY